MANKYKTDGRMSPDDDSYEDEYSDDFDDEPSTNRRYKTSPMRTDRSNRGRGRGSRGYRGNMTGRSQDSNVDNITKRVLSARRLKINELRNNNEEMNNIIKELKEENKLLKRSQLRQEKALQRFEDRESDLPQLMQRQTNEVRSYKDQIRKWREKFEKADRYLRDAEDELDKTKHQYKKLKQLSEEKELPERSDLNKKLTKAELDLEEKEVKIRELEKHIQNLQKNHRHELGIEMARQRETQKQLLQVKDEQSKLQEQVKEKEKELQMKNIYSNRMVKPPHRLPNSYSGTPHDTPPPGKHRRNSLTDMTPRDKAKLFEEKRREEMRKQRELKQQQEKERREQEVRRREESERRRREDKDRERRDREERDRQERDREDRDREEWEERRRKEEEERRMKSERERMKQEAEDREREERARREREERERRERREREERDRREKERLEQERRAREERERFDNDPKIDAERKKKDLILQKLREIDEGGHKDKEKAKNGYQDPFFVTNPRSDSNDSMSSSKKSYNFTRPVENMHQGKPSHDDFSFGASQDKKKQKKDVDTLTSGGYNPTFGSRNTGAKSGPRTLSLFDDDSAQKKTPKKDEATSSRKSKLMDDLFGGQAKSDSQQDAEVFPSSNRPKKETGGANRATMFPWDDEPRPKNASYTKRENSSTLFGGGNAFVNDEEVPGSGKQSKRLPRRQNKTTTAFHARPAVTAVGQFNEDDIEEVML